MDTVKTSLGRNVRATRLRLSMTQQQLADACNLSKGMISKVENGVVVPALATLTRMASVMHVKVFELLETDDTPASRVVLNPFTDENKFIMTDMGYRMYSLVAGLSETAMQPILIMATEQNVKAHTVSHPGEEYIFVFSGEMNFTVDSSNYLLRSGDSLFFDASLPHGISHVTDMVQYVDIFVGHHHNPEGGPEG